MQGACSDQHSTETALSKVYNDILSALNAGLSAILLMMDLSVVFDTIDHDILRWLQTTKPTSGGAVTADSSCCANCVEPPRPQQWGPDLPFLGMPAMPTRWMAGAAAHKSG